MAATEASEIAAFVPVRDAMSLESKRQIARIVVEDALAQFERPVAMWTGGKDSTLMLWFLRSVATERSMECPPILFIDHGTHFEETWDLMKEVASSWSLRTIIARNEDVLSQHPSPGEVIRVKDLSLLNQQEAARTGSRERTFPYALGNLVANHLLKTVPMNDAIVQNGFDCVFTGIRWDEDDARARERF